VCISLVECRRIEFAAGHNGSIAKIFANAGRLQCRLLQRANNVAAQLQEPASQARHPAKSVAVLLQEPAILARHPANSFAVLLQEPASQATCNRWHGIQPAFTSNVAAQLQEPVTQVEKLSNSIAVLL
jgi:hypothetical protein